MPLVIMALKGGHTQAHIPMHEQKRFQKPGARMHLEYNRDRLEIYENPLIERTIMGLMGHIEKRT